MPYRLAALLTLTMTLGFGFASDACGQGSLPSTIRDRSPTFTQAGWANSTIRSRSPVISRPSRLWWDWKYGRPAAAATYPWYGFATVPNAYYQSVVRYGPRPFLGLDASRHWYPLAAPVAVASEPPQAALTTPPYGVPGDPAWSNPYGSNYAAPP